MLWLLLLLLLVNESQKVPEHKSKRVGEEGESFLPKGFSI